jgi:hypothetical protein
MKCHARFYPILFPGDQDVNRLEDGAERFSHAEKYKKGGHAPSALSPPYGVIGDYVRGCGTMRM